MSDPSIPPDVAARRALMERLSSESVAGHRSKAPFDAAPSPSLVKVWLRLIVTGVVLIGVCFLLIQLCRYFLGLLQGFGFGASA